MVLNYPMRENGMYILTKEAFDEIAEMVIDKYMPDVLLYPKAVDIEMLATDYLYLNIQYWTLSPEGNILGLVVFEDTEIEVYDIHFNRISLLVSAGTILLDMHLIGKENMARRRFTLAHEVAHWICHRTYHSPWNKKYEFRINSEMYKSLEVNMVACRTGNIERVYRTNSLKTDSDWEEYQADALAAALLMPRQLFEEACKEMMYKMGFMHNYLVEGEDVEKSKRVIKEIMKTFQVSYRAVQIRMLQCGMIIRRGVTNKR